MSSLPDHYDFFFFFYRSAPKILVVTSALVLRPHRSDTPVFRFTSNEFQKADGRRPRVTAADEVADKGDGHSEGPLRGLLRNIVKANHKRGGENGALLCVKQFQPMRRAATCQDTS